MANHLECALDSVCSFEVVVRKVTTDNDFLIFPLLMLEEEEMKNGYQEQCHYRTHHNLNVNVHRTSQKERHRPRKDYVE